jgi:hypothetical protein
VSGFESWLRKRYGKADTPMGDLAREFRGLWADSDDRARLRASIEYHVGSENWALALFDTAWDEYVSTGGGQ